jgi:hypothetical protein
MKPFAILFAVVLAAATPRAQELEARVKAFVDGAQQPFEFMRMPLSARTVKGAPYSAETVNESQQMLSDGNRISHRTTGRVYRDGQGRTRHEEDRADGTQSISIIDPVAGVAYSLNSKTRVAVKTPSAVGFAVMNKVGAVGGAITIDGVTRERFDVQLKAMTDAMAKGPGVTKEYGGKQQVRDVREALAARTIEGVRAEGSRGTVTIPADAIGNDLPIVITSEEWTSPELQVLVLTDHNDPRTGRSTYRLLRISRTDLDPALFQVPADYTIQRAPAGPAGGRGGRGQ